MPTLTHTCLCLCQIATTHLTCKINPGGKKHRGWVHGQREQEAVGGQQKRVIKVPACFGCRVRLHCIWFDDHIAFDYLMFHQETYVLLCALLKAGLYMSQQSLCLLTSNLSHNLVESVNSRLGYFPSLEPFHCKFVNMFYYGNLVLFQAW